MRLTKTLIAAALATSFGGSVMAGGFAPEVIDTPVVIIDPPAAPRSSWGIILPIAAVGLLIALASSDDSE